MKRAVFVTLLVAAAFAAGGLIAYRWAAREAPLPDGPALVAKVREVARLETLDVSLYRKVSFEPDPQPTGSLWGDLATWARHTVRAPRGKAIVFAEAHLSLDLRKIDERRLRVRGRAVDVVLPPVQVQVELRPAETEIIGSNLDSGETALLFEKARAAFEAEVAGDERLRERARESGKQTLRALLRGLGFTEVNFVRELPREAGAL